MSDKFKDWVTDILGLFILVIATYKLTTTDWAIITMAKVSTIAVIYLMGLGTFLLPDSQIKKLVIKIFEAMHNWLSKK